jgi:hypothetical protein
MVEHNMIQMNVTGLYHGRLQGRGGGGTCPPGLPKYRRPSLFTDFLSAVLLIRGLSLAYLQFYEEIWLKTV